MRSKAVGAVLSHSPFIAVIAHDPALLRSLAFTLQAHGYRVEQFRSWGAARERIGAASGVIVDGGLPTADLKACLSLDAKVVLLAEDDAHIFGWRDLQVLHKPLSGSDVVAALAALREYP